MLMLLDRPKDKIPKDQPKEEGSQKIYIPHQWLGEALKKHATQLLDAERITFTSAYLPAHDAVAHCVVGDAKGLPAGVRYTFGVVNGNTGNRQQLKFYSGVSVHGNGVPLFCRQVDKITLMGRKQTQVEGKVDRVIRDQLCLKSELGEVSDRWHKMMGNKLNPLTATKYFMQAGNDKLLAGLDLAEAEPR